jgi:hypothetical protein
MYGATTYRRAYPGCTLATRQAEVRRPLAVVVLTIRHAPVCTEFVRGISDRTELISPLSTHREPADRVRASWGINLLWCCD